MTDDTQKANGPTYSFIGRSDLTHNNRCFSILREVDAFIILDLNVVLVQDTINLSNIIHQRQLVAQMVLVGVDDPICKKVLERCNVRLRGPVAKPDEITERRQRYYTEDSATKYARQRISY